ncbi:MAG: type II secretion system F family protein [Fibrobacterales bacterium]
MATWIYKAVNSQGKEVFGEFEAANKAAAQSLIRKKRLRVNSLKKKPIEFNITIGSGIKKEDVARFTRQFSAMTSAGLPLIQCLDILTEQSENVFLKEVLKKVTGRIQGGSTLADALSQHPKTFNDLYCNMVAAGEAGGILDVILKRLADYQESAERLKRKIKGAMTYPAIVTFVAVGVIFIMLWKVVPIFAGMYDGSGKALPMPTQVVLGISNFVQNNALFILAAVAALAIALIRYYKTDNGRYVIDNLKLNAPVLGNLERKSAIARFTRTLGTLLNCGVSIIDALKVTSKTSGNRVLEIGVNRTLESISGGNTIADPLRDTGIFPPMVIQMISVGEKTGGLPDMLTKVSDFYDEEVDAAVENLTSMIEPIIIVVMGLAIGFIMIAMYMPMFSMADTI